MGAPGINTGTTTTPGVGIESTSNTTGGTSSAATLLKGTRMRISSLYFLNIVQVFMCY